MRLKACLYRNKLKSCNYFLTPDQFSGLRYICHNGKQIQILVMSTLAHCHTFILGHHNPYCY